MRDGSCRIRERGRSSNVWMRLLRRKLEAGVARRRATGPCGRRTPFDWSNSNDESGFRSARVSQSHGRKASRGRMDMLCKLCWKDDRMIPRIRWRRRGEIIAVWKRGDEAARTSQVVKLRGASLNLTQRYLTATTGGGAVSTRCGREAEETSS